MKKIYITLFAFLMFFKVQAQDFKKAVANLEKDLNVFVAQKQKSITVDSVVAYTKHLRAELADKIGEKIKNNKFDSDGLPHCSYSIAETYLFERVNKQVMKLSLFKKDKKNIKANGRAPMSPTTRDYVVFLWPGVAISDTKALEANNKWNNSSLVTSKVVGNVFQYVTLTGSEFAIGANISATLGNATDWLLLNYNANGTDGERFVFYFPSAVAGMTSVSEVSTTCTTPSITCCIKYSTALVTENVAAHEEGHALGVSVHSSDNTNIMYVSVPGNPQIKNPEAGLVSSTNAAMAASGCVALTALPIELINFSANSRDKQNILSFETATERNNSHFMLERSRDGIDFEDFGRVKGHGTTSEAHRYTYTDQNPYALTYYRLKSVDYDGAKELSKIIAVTKGNKNITISPTLISDYLNIHANETTENLSINIIDVTGKTVFSKAVQNLESDYRLDLSTLVSGTYFISVFDGVQTEVSKVVKL